MSEPRNQMISIKVSEEEYNLVKAKVNEEGLTISEFIRKKILREEQSRNTLFEQRAMKILTGLAAYIQFVSENEMSDEEFDKFYIELKAIREKMGVSLDSNF